jgi:vacuolar-type H+-ATPase subunit H
MPASRSVRKRPARVEEGTPKVDEKVLEEIQFHQDVIKKDASSPLYQIREKEIEISGRVLAARKKAETVVADSRKKAAETVTKAEVDADTAAKELEERVVAEAKAEAERLRNSIGSEVADAEKQIAARRSRAVDVVAKAVTQV